MPLGVPVVTWKLSGPSTRDFNTGRYAPASFIKSAEFIEEFEYIGRKYEAELKKVWASKHGRTGETEDSISGELTVGDARTIPTTYAIRIAGQVGFVINPLPPHVILPKAPEALYNPFMDAGQGRTTNFYSEFGPVKGVEWVQGASSESYGPDPEWYKDAEPQLRADATYTLATMGNILSVLWGEDNTLTTWKTGF